MGLPEAHDEEEPAPSGKQSFMQNVLTRSPKLAAVASINCLVLAIVTYAWGVASSIEFIRGLVTDEAWRDSTPIVALLAGVDLLLIGTTLLIVALGLWELFVAEVAFPAWLVINDFGDLKVKVSESLVLVLVVKFLEKFVGKTPPLDLLYIAGAVALVCGVLIAYSTVRPPRH